MANLCAYKSRPNQLLLLEEQSNLDLLLLGAQINPAKFFPLLVALWGILHVPDKGEIGEFRATQSKCVQLHFFGQQKTTPGSKVNWCCVLDCNQVRSRKRIDVVYFILDLLTRISTCLPLCTLGQEARFNPFLSAS